MELSPSQFQLNSQELSSNEIDTSSHHLLFRFYGETITFTILLLLGFLTNGPFLVIYLKSKHTRATVDKFIFNLLMADGLCVLILLPTILTDLMLPEEELDLSILITSTLDSTNGHVSSILTPSIVNDTNDLGINQQTIVNVIKTAVPLAKSSWSCAIKKSLLSGISTASILASLQIAVERYLAVVNPLHYHEFLTKRMVLTISAIGILIVFTSAFLSALDPCQPVFPGCVQSSSSLSDTYWWPSYTLAHVSIFFIGPILIMTFIYVKIWWEAKRQRAKMNSQCKKPFFVHLPNYTNGEDTMISHTTGDEMRRGKRFYLHPILLKFKLIERLVAPRMDRAARVGICTLCVTILCWGPYYFVETSHAFESILDTNVSGRYKAWNHYESILPLFFASLHPIIAPFFYAYRYKRVRGEVLKMCYLDNFCFHKNQCVGQKKISTVTDFHDPSHFHPSPSKSNQILTPAPSEVGFHHLNLSDSIHPYFMPISPNSPPESPKPPKFLIGSESDLDLDNCILPKNQKESIPITINLPPKIISSPSHGGMTSALINCLAAWLTSYSERWGNHRESVTSTTSADTLLSTIDSPQASMLPSILVTPSFNNV